MISNNDTNLNLSFHPPNPCLLPLPRFLTLSLSLSLRCISSTRGRRIMTVTPSKSAQFSRTFTRTPPQINRPIPTAPTRFRTATANVDCTRLEKLSISAITTTRLKVIDRPRSRRREVQCLNLHSSTSQDIPIDCMAKESTTGGAVS